MSLAASSSDFINQFGSDQVDFQIKGYTDFSDIKNPKVSATVDLTNQFSAEIRKADKIIYFKINKLPVFLTAFMGSKNTNFDSVLSNWVSYDNTPLDTEASRNLPTPSITNNPATDKLLTTLVNDKVLPLVKVNKETLDGTPTYHLKFTPTADQADSIDESFQKIKPGTTFVGTKQNFSDNIKDLSVSLWINQDNNYINKGLVTFSVVNNSTFNNLNTMPLSMPQVSEAAIAFAVKLSDYGKVQNIDLPDNSITVDQYLKLLLSNSTK